MPFSLYNLIVVFCEFCVNFVFMLCYQDWKVFSGVLFVIHSTFVTINMHLIIFLRSCMLLHIEIYGITLR